MPKYIDAEKIEWHTLYFNGGKQEITYKDEVDALPDEDIAPVIHAKWVPGKMSYSCSNCLCVNDFVDLSTCYCPNCGAKMDIDAIGTVEYEIGGTK